MSTSIHHQPAWQTEELQEEWIDLEPEDSDDDNNHTRSLSLTAPLSTHIHTNSELDAGTPNTTRPVGTFLVREDVGHIPVLPKTPGRVAKGAIKDFFTPLPLERMFDPPTPPTIPKSAQIRPTPSPPQSAVLINAPGSDGPSDEILETDMPDMRPFQGRKSSLACQFTFAIPKDVISRNNHLNPQAHSTPNPPSAPPTDSRLRLFQFQYDTYTREHLSAMVDSIAVNTPSGTTTTVTPQSYGQHLSRVSEATGTAPNMSHLRSAKRIKLSPATEFYGEGAGENMFISRPKGKDYVGESRSLMEKIKQARDFSTISTVASSKESPSQDTKASPSGESVIVNRVFESGKPIPCFPLPRLMLYW
jgi:hypothetical protein